MPRPDFKFKKRLEALTVLNKLKNIESTPETSDKRVTFKQSRRRGNKNKAKDWSAIIREHLDDEDVDMNIGSASVKNCRYKKGAPKNSLASPKFRKRLLEAVGGWYKVSIPYGDKYEKEFITNLIKRHIAPLEFNPIAWQTNGTTTIFYINNYALADKLLDLDRQMQLPNGFKLIFKVHPGTPHVDMTVELKEKMKIAMARRYNLANKALDLSKFYADSDLQHSFCSLYKPVIFLTVLDIIFENIPDIEAICLDDNGLTQFEYLRKQFKKLSHLKIFHVARNKIKDVTHLDVMCGLPITELVLTGNPLCDKYKEQSTYVRYTVF